MAKLSVVIITGNEEKLIADAVNSASFADEVLVLDCGSTDKTCDIARGLGAGVTHQDWLGFGSQKNRAVELARNDWVFVLDADERITPDLQAEVLSALQNPSSAGFLVPRLNRFFGKDIRRCGLYPDYSLRLFNRQHGKFNDLPIHESVQLNGTVSKLKNHITHLAYETIEEFITKQNRYSSLHYKRSNVLKAVFSPGWTFFRIYFLKRGVLDGWHGFVIARLYAQYTFWKYVKVKPGQIKPIEDAKTENRHD